MNKCTNCFATEVKQDEACNSEIFDYKKDFKRTKPQLKKEEVNKEPWKTFNGYQAAAMRSGARHPTMEKGILINSLGLVGETIELFETVKQIDNISSHETRKDKIIKEAGDVCWYIAGIMTYLGNSLSVLVGESNDYYVTEWNPQPVSQHPLTSLLMLSGEVAEVTKKTFGHGHPIDKLKYINSLGKCLTNVFTLVQVQCKAHLHEVFKQNILKLMDRYPDGFKTEQSLHRKENNDT